MPRNLERFTNLLAKSTVDHETKNDLWITKCVFPEKRSGFFVEAGAADGKLGSSCYILETRFDWTGICIEPNCELFRQLVAQRPRSICENVCLSDQAGYVAFVQGDSRSETLYLSGIKENLEKYKHNHENILLRGKETMKESRSLREVLKRNDAPKSIDYAAFDIEGSEYEVLKNFPFDEYRISALSLECDWHIWDKITELLTAHCFREVKNQFNTDKSWERYWLHKSFAGDAMNND